MGLVSFVFTLWGHKTKETYPTRPGSPTPCKKGLRENVKAFFPQGQSKLSVMMRCPYEAGVRKAAFDCNSKKPCSRLVSAYSE